VSYTTILFWFASIGGGLALGLSAPLHSASNTKRVFAIGVGLVLASIGLGYSWQYSWGDIRTAITFIDADIPKYYWLARMSVVGYAAIVGALTLHVRAQLRKP
jgi:hypothetical protein